MQQNHLDDENDNFNFQGASDNEVVFNEDGHINEFANHNEKKSHNLNPENQTHSEATASLGSTDEREPLNILTNASFTIKCEVGEVNLSFKEIENLKVGDSLEFIKWPGSVKLRLNNLIFAEGYLVEVNNMLGVKITNRYTL